MTHSEIMKQWIGERYRENGIKTYECVGWDKLYCSLRGRPIGYFKGSAYKGFITGSPFNKNWVKVLPTPFNYPGEGDVVFWGPTWGKGYGHTAIANKFCNPLVLRTTDQNAGSGNGDGLAKNAINPFFRSYSGVIGWYKYIG